ncbi:MAG: NAD(P)-dependent glycerol-3-phosphate dehydrogenase [Planctomycetota bacterium]|nr:MAG: NAD(P)-dependent glycerol-3-phosphate dehydrogenase [Planctomycetota bacterium]
MAYVTLLGGGSWGTALAQRLALNGHKVRLWVRNSSHAQAILESRENSKYLPGYTLSQHIYPTSSLKEAMEDIEFLIIVVPSHGFLEVLEKASPLLPFPCPILSATKGILQQGLQFTSQVLDQIFPEYEKAYLSGPNFAKEVMAQLPAATVIASTSREVAQKFQNLFHCSSFRVYTSTDVIGVLVGGAVKNVIALATGISDGMELGLNARAALITRGLAEIARLGKRLGASPLTLSGLAGMGDLVLTCTGDLSRNRQVGLRLGQGESLEEILSSMNMVAEGVKTSKALEGLRQKYDVEMPISHQVYQILYHQKSPRTALEELMSRPHKSEIIY